MTKLELAKNLETLAALKISPIICPDISTMRAYKQNMMHCLLIDYLLDNEPDIGVMVDNFEESI